MALLYRKIGRSFLWKCLFSENLGKSPVIAIDLIAEKLASIQLFYGESERNGLKTICWPCWNRLLNIQYFKVFWSVNLSVPWTWFWKLPFKTFFFILARMNVYDRPTVWSFLRSFLQAVFERIMYRFSSFSRYKKATNGENSHATVLERSCKRSGTSVVYFSRVE